VVEPHLSSWCEVNAAALHGNIGALRAMLAPGALLGVVVKSDAYGHGLALAARTGSTEVEWVRGHDGNTGNEVADQVANAGRDYGGPGVSIEATALRCVPDQTWQLLKKRNPAMPVLYTSIDRAISTAPTQETASAAAHERQLKSWSKRIKHGYLLREMRGYSERKTSIKLLGRQETQATLTKKGTWKRHCSLTFLTKLMCSDLPLMDPLHRHESAPEEDEELQDKCPRCMAGPETFWDCPDIQDDILRLAPTRATEAEPSSLRRDRYYPGPLIETALSAGETKSTNSSALAACYAIWKQRNRRLRDRRKEMSA